MSWNYTVENVTAETADDALGAGAEKQAEYARQGDVGPESIEQIEQAVYAAVEIIKSGCLGEGPFRVTLGGHANAGHRPREGWSNDAINLAIYQQDRGTA